MIPPGRHSAWGPLPWESLVPRGGLFLLLQFCSWLTLQPEGQEPLMGLRIWQVAELGYTPQALRGHLALKNNTTMLVLSGI